MRTAVTAALVALALLASLVGPARAQPACPTPVPIEQLVAGERATGLTVVRGTEPERFDVEILGVLNDGLAPGRDVIVVDTSGPAIDEAGGVWSGMSGSPVYLGDPAAGRLIGAVAYGFSSGPSSIAGLTPAEDLLELLHEGATTPNGATTGLAAQQAVQGAGGLRRLPTPLSVSGLAHRSADEVQQFAHRAGLPVLVTPGGGGGAPAAAGPVAGGNFAAVLSTGDVTAAVIGTTSIVCEGRAVALGHEFTAAGATTLSANSASAIAIVDDPADGPFKLANVGPGFGTVDQDRWSGVRVALGQEPATVPVHSEVTAIDRGVSRPGDSRVVRSADVPLSAALHLVGNIDAIADRVGAGSATLDVRVIGRTSDGTPFTYERSDAFVSADDISNETAFTESYDALKALASAPGGVTFEEVTFDAQVSPQVATYEIAEVRVGVDGAEPVPATPEHLIVAGSGGVLDVVVVLRPTLGGAERVVPLTVGIPGGTAGGTLMVTGGGADDQPLPQTSSVENLVAALQARPTNAEISATFVPHEQGTTGATPRDAAVLDQVVRGAVAVPALIQPETHRMREVLGADRVGTAAALSADSYTTTETVVLATAGGYADALAAAPLAATLQAPILLTDPTMLRPEVAEEITRLGARQAVLLGGEQALGPEVQAALDALGVSTRRVAGADRYETAARSASEIGGDAVYVAGNWPDALSVSALAAAQRRPILLVTRDAVPAATGAAFEALGVADVTVVGGPAAVDQAVLDQLGQGVRRVAGGDRYATSLEVTKLAVTAGASPQDVTLATGLAFPDALAAGPAVAAAGGVLLLLDGEAPAGSPSTYAYLSEIRETLSTVRFLGGSAAIAPEVREAVADTLRVPGAVVPPATGVG